VPDVPVVGSVQARVTEAVERFGTVRVASALDVKPASVSRYKNGNRQLKPGQIVALANLLGASADYVLGSTPDPRGIVVERVVERVVEVKVPDPPADWRGYSRLPLAGEVGAGPGREVAFEPEKAERYVFRNASLGRWGGKANLVLARVAKRSWGESMLPAIRPGAVLLYRTDIDQIRDGAIHVIRIKDEGTVVKRLFLAEPGEVVIWSDNPATKPRVRTIARNNEEWSVLGRVVWVGQEQGQEP
jgi:hypothetical protein